MGQKTVPVWPRANQRLSAVRLRWVGHALQECLTQAAVTRAKVVMGPDRTRQACAQHTVEAFRGRHRAEEATTQAFLVLLSPWTRFHQHWREKRGPQRLVADKGMWVVALPRNGEKEKRRPQTWASSPSRRLEAQPTREPFQTEVKAASERDCNTTAVLPDARVRAQRCQPTTRKTPRA